MSYKYSFDLPTKSTLDPVDFVQAQNDEYEMSNELDFDFVDVGYFDADEIL
jgi:hypothetical protein